MCSGIEAATVAWSSIPGWEPAFFSEIDPFARAVLAHHYPEVPLHGDFTTIGADDYGAIDLLVGGTPCQSFSVAGLRGGMADERGNLALEFLRLADRKRPRWVVWENVPGVLSTNGGRDFGAFLGGLGELGYGWAYRVLDAQYFGVAQRRRRVFVVGCLGDERRAGAVLFERDCLSGGASTRREAREVTPSLTSSGAGVSRVKGAARSDDLEWIECVVAAQVPNYYAAEVCPTIGSSAAGFSRTGNARTESEALVVAFSCKDSGADATVNLAPTLRSMNEVDGNQNGGGQVAIADGVIVRRIMPVETERLQGLPDGYTDIVWTHGKRAADQPRYHAIGNSFATVVVRWIGQRIAAVDAIVNSGAA